MSARWFKVDLENSGAWHQWPPWGVDGWWGSRFGTERLPVCRRVVPSSMVCGFSAGVIHGKPQIPRSIARAVRALSRRILHRPGNSVCSDELWLHSRSIASQIQSASRKVLSLTLREYTL